MKKHPVLNLPPCALDIRPDADSRRGADKVYDRLRQRWVSLTPEEWVRQHFVAFLILQRAFPPQFMTNELGLKLNGTQRRADTMVYTPSLRPLAVVEYKAPEVTLTQKVFDQIARYNIVMGAPYLIVSNGMHHFCCRYRDGGYVFLPDIPAYPDMLAETSGENNK